MSFNHIKHKNDTELSKEFWEIKKRNSTPKIIGKITKIFGKNRKGKYEPCNIKKPSLCCKQVIHTSTF